MNHHPIVICNDGDTWCHFDNCEAIYVTESGYEKLHEGAKIRELIPGEDYRKSTLRFFIGEYERDFTRGL